MARTKRNQAKSMGVNAEGAERLLRMIDNPARRSG
jgi:hypothetical protein